MELTFENLPQAVKLLANEVSELRKMLLEKNVTQPDPDRWFDLNELCNYHPDKPSRPTVYFWVQAGAIPVHKGGKKLRFLKSEIDNWLLQGKKKTLVELRKEAEQFCNNKKG